MDRSQRNIKFRGLIYLHWSDYSNFFDFVCLLLKKLTNEAKI